MIIQSNDKQMLVPQPWSGVPSQARFDRMEWLQSLPDATYLALWQRWPTQNLPVGYRSYIVSFHLEPVDYDWIDFQSQRIDAPIVILHDGQYYDWPKANHVTSMRYICWHHQLDKMIKWFGPVDRIPRERRYMASAYCSRITQSKLLIFTALAEYLGMDHCLLTLSSWLEEKNVHFRQDCGRAMLDNLAQIFWTKYWGQTLSHDHYNQSLNYQSFTANFHGQYYMDSAVHFTNESYHYSLMGDHKRPGPFITEKTLKCLAAGQIFVPVGQFDIYGTLERLGFKFDYAFNTKWDQDPGNLTRIEKIVELIQGLKDSSIQDVMAKSIDSCEHNLDHVYSGNFAKICQNINDLTVQNILCMLK